MSALPALIPADAALLTRFLLAREDLIVLRAQPNAPDLLALLAFLARPDITPWLDQYRTLQAHAHREAALAALTSVFHSTTDPTQLRLAASTLLNHSTRRTATPRARRPAIEPDDARDGAHRASDQRHRVTHANEPSARPDRSRDPSDGADRARDRSHATTRARDRELAPAAPLPTITRSPAPDLSEPTCAPHRSRHAASSPSAPDAHRRTPASLIARCGREAPPLPRALPTSASQRLDSG